MKSNAAMIARRHNELLDEVHRLRAENEALKADVSDLLRYLPARVVAAWREDKLEVSRRIDAALRGEGE